MALLLVVAVGTGCAPGAEEAAEPPEGPRIVQPGAPGEETRVLTSEDLATLPGVTFAAADVAFMQGMIGHHAQAIEMAALVEERTTNEEIRSLAQRIDISQADEIGSMERWLTARGEDPPAAGMGHHGHAPGMLSAEQMAELSAASGDEFDRLFLRYMIQHHEGALVMVRDLMASPGAAQESEIFAFASDVEGDQQIEIERMSAMLQEMER
jgi:uncharacterized protein (DUF305 family)